MKKPQLIDDVWYRDVICERPAPTIAHQSSPGADWALAQPVKLTQERRSRDAALAAEWYIQCELYGLDSLHACVEIDADRRGGVPVLKGSRFTIAELFAEISETDGPSEVANYFDLDQSLIKEVLLAFSALINKPFISR